MIDLSFKDVFNKQIRMIDNKYVFFSVYSLYIPF